MFCLQSRAWIHVGVVAFITQSNVIWSVQASCLWVKPEPLARVCVGLRPPGSAVCWPGHGLSAVSSPCDLCRQCPDAADFQSDNERGDDRRAHAE